MGIEAGQYLADLDKEWPLQDDERSEGDDHLRLIKAVVKQTFPGAAGEGYSVPIKATELDLNNLTGTLGNVQEQIDSKPSDDDVVHISGDTMSGELIVQENIYTQFPTGANVLGFGITNAAKIEYGAIVYDKNDSKIHIKQRDDLTSGFATNVTLYAGKISVTSETGYNTTCSIDSDLANKYYVDLKFAESLTAGSEGALIVPYDPGRQYAGLDIVSTDYTKNLVRFVYNSSDQSATISQTGTASDGLFDTIITSKYGHVSVTSTSGLSTNPTSSDHLTNKEYVDSVSGKAGADGRIVVEHWYGDDYSGVIIEDGSVDAAFFAWQKSTKKLAIIQRGNGQQGSPDTIATFSDGVINVTSANGQSTAPSDTNDLANKQYVDSQIQVLLNTVSSLKSRLAALEGA